MTGGRNIIIGVDDSDASAYAFEWAVRHLLKQSDHLLVLTAQTYMPASSLPTVDLAVGGEYAVPVVISADETQEQELADAAKGLVDKYMQLCERAKVPCEGEVVKGDPGTHICEEAERIGADLVIVGTHGYGVLKRTFVGSISDYVLHHCPAPVIVVRTTEDPKSEEAVKHEESNTLVIAVDSSPESAFAFTWALKNVCTEEDKVIILHVQNPVPLSAASLGVDQFGVEEIYVPPDSSNQDDVKQLSESEKLVEKYMQFASNTKIHCEGRVVTGYTEEKVCSELSTLNAKAVVVGSHRSSALAKTFLGSVSDHLAHYSPCPVIVAKLPPPEALDAPAETKTE